MMKYIYVDVLIVVNLYVNWLMLNAVCKITNSKTSNIRKVLASLFGALLSLSVLLEPFGITLSIAYKLLGSLIINLICFGKKKLLKNSVLFLVSSFLFSGVSLAFSMLFSSNNTLVSNGSVYFDISFLTLFIFTSAAYLIICILKYFFDKSAYKNGAFTVTIDTGLKKFSLKGIADTGNLLVDNISGKPVIVCSKDDFDFDLSLLAVGSKNKNLKGLRYLPYSTVSGDSALPVFSPHTVEIIDQTNGNTKKVEAVIGLSENCKAAIFNPKILF